MHAMLRNKLKWPTQLKYDIVFLFFWNSCTNGKSNINLVQLFKYTLKHYVTYSYEYMCQKKIIECFITKEISTEQSISTRNRKCYMLWTIENN